MLLWRPASIIFQSNQPHNFTTLTMLSLRSMQDGLQYDSCPISYAIINGDVNIVRALIDSGVDVNIDADDDEPVRGGG